MNLQEQEHWDYEGGCQSELQNAYDRSRMEIDTVGDRNKISDLVSQGKTVLFYEVDVCCPSTDAFIASVPHILDVCDDGTTGCELQAYMINHLGYDHVCKIGPDDKPIKQAVNVEIYEDVPF